ncbi:hypothetical protein OAE70_01805, partial [bacterium]|nr:hypothetical protein [bacterium]
TSQPLAILNFEVMVMIFWFKSRDDEIIKGAFSKVRLRSKENKTKNESDTYCDIWMFSPAETRNRPTQRRLAFVMAFSS